MSQGILSGVLFINTIGAIGFFRGKKRTTEEMEEEETKKTNLLCRFVLDGVGRKIGESVAIDDDILIVKSGMKYLGIPLKHIEKEEKTLLVKGLVDQYNAEMMGEKWRQESFKEIKYSDDE
jgi:hypothetical protein